ncbi:hypothetical protein VCSRO93_3483 [Vibrio cholerae]|uniref:hypothetical protein n=1 Tax=Vibrio cholerae TaxID=666 RepID=UPI000510B5CF|nr:hypothetical protein [Vibrio cholerae]MEB5557632.1 hypothetical protein [Vibrio cholerae]BCN22014.1 hypothetical protein [Vibrio cholerae]GIB62831.1 hypothetical protein VCSRO93_3483 [Vibrio cholerae]HBC3477455.1 hypothetical protein [Vibrio cholerae]
MERLIKLIQESNFKNELESPVVQWTSFFSFIIFVWWLVLNPYIEWRSQTVDQLEQKTHQLERLIQLKASDRVIRETIDDLNVAYSTAEQMLIKERTNSRAISIQVNEFEKIYRSFGLKFSGRRFGEPEVSSWLGERVDSQWRLEGRSDDILYMLYAIASSKTIIEPISIEIKQGRKIRNQTEPNYEISLDIRSYRQLPIKELKMRSDQ